MQTCSNCAAEIAAGNRYCPACGAAQSSVSQMPTAMATPPTRPQAPAPTATIGRLESSASFASASFQPGQVIAGRYRVVGLLGRGGMGEVYRADDLELSQSVALKFIGRAFAGRPDMLERFRAEVRNARGVSHPNVCRVYDIGEVDGQTFLSMEYVDGEDLATLLKRIGRLPRAKADEVARQLCAGLAAAHDRGVIHRDLKPSNVMIDGEGRVRLTDFGLAVRLEDGGGAEVAGTPAYMAPEQFDGRAITVQTDLYAAGLILYETYTGRRALDAATFDGWRTQHSQIVPRSPDELERDVDEPVARAIQRCLEKDPARRPRSALQLAASLPGGDPVMAALAAGETPSPQMVAASGGEGALDVRAAWWLLGGVLALIAALVALAPAATDLGLAPFTQSPAALEAKAREIGRELGYTTPPRDRATMLWRLYEPLRWRAQNEISTHWRRDYGRLGAPLVLGYRESPKALAPVGPRVTGVDPPATDHGSTSTFVDGEGRLVDFLAVPGPVDSVRDVASPFPAARLFALAGLDTASFREVTPVLVPRTASTLQREWVGTSERLVGAELRVGIDWWGSRPVGFRIRGPWSERPITRLGDLSAQNLFSTTLLLVFVVLMLVFGIVVGKRRLRSGRSDWRGGLAVANAIVAARIVQWVFYAHHPGDPLAGFSSFFLAFSYALAQACFVFFLYVAVEPYVRRHTPELLIGWARLIQGRFRDPRVGRDVLIGALFGAAIVVVIYLINALPTWIPVRGQTPVPPNTDVLLGGPLLVGVVLGAPFDQMGATLSLFGLWFLLRVVTRRALIASLGTALLMTLLSLGAENPIVETPGALVYGALAAWLIARFGLLALLASWCMRALLLATPLPVVSGAPYAFQSALLLGLLVVAVIASFRVSLGGKRPWSFGGEDGAGT